MSSADRFREIRSGIAEISGDVSNDAVGDRTPKLEDIFAPETHAAALNPSTPIVVGSRGTGKSFWSGVLGQDDTRVAAAKAYPKLGLQKLKVYFGFTGIGGPDGIGSEELNSLVAPSANVEQAKVFWWASILRAAARSSGDTSARVRAFMDIARDFEKREELLLQHETRFRESGQMLLVVYDALDMVATSWPRRRLLTEGLIEVAWAMRAFRAIKLKLFLRPDQIDDDALRFVELPKLRTGAVRLEWTSADLYGLLFSRLALSQDESCKKAFEQLLRKNGIQPASRDEILSRRWKLSHDYTEQARVMEQIAGPFMADGPYGYKKGKTYDWPITHLSDAHQEVTPRSFLGLMIAAAGFGAAPIDRVITAEGIRHGLRAASKTRVDQLHQEFPWIKGVLAPLAGLLLPQSEKEVYKAWKRAKTIESLLADASTSNYLPPFSTPGRESEGDLFVALERIGVMFRRKDNRIDMPDLFRVAAKLLKKGSTAPI